MHATRFCRCGRVLLSASEKPLISIRTQQFKQSVPNASKSPKPVSAKKHDEAYTISTPAKEIVTNYGSTWHLGSHVSADKTAEKENLVTFDNIFMDGNKRRVLQKMVAGPETDALNLEQRRSAVLVPLCYVGGEPSLLFMVRSRHLKVHRGEISFPGGMEDPVDADLTHTALRETYEEIGLPSEQVEVWGQLRPAPSKTSGSWVTPIVGLCGELDISKLHLNHSEVEDVFTCTIASICDPANQRQTQWRYPGTRGFTLPVFLGGKYRIWGLTAIILHQVMTFLAPGLYKFKLRHRS